MKFLGGLPKDATEEEITKAYRLLVQLYHPDKNPNRPEWSTESMRCLNEAREILSDPIKRKQYERILAEKLSAAERERQNINTVKKQNMLLQRKVQTVQKSNDELKFTVGLAAFAFILAAISE